MALTIDPIRIFEIKGQIYTVLTNSAVLTAGLNQVIVANTSGYKVRVMGWGAQGVSGAVTGYYRFKDGSGGSIFFNYLGAPLVASGFVDKFPIENCGYMETTAGNGLYADSTTADVTVLVHYILYAA